MEANIVPLETLRRLFETLSNEQIVEQIKPSTVIENQLVMRKITRWMLGGASRWEVLEALRREMS